MVREILENIAPIEALDKKYGVVSLFLFGSAARHATLTEVRDFDFLVQFQAMPPVEYAHSYFGFAEELEALFNTNWSERCRPVALRLACTWWAFCRRS
jgi:predicted nucleotidyltransferase